MLTTARAHSYSYPHPSPIQDHPKDIGPTHDSHTLLATSHTLTVDISEAEGQYTVVDS